jgi:SAM-dependent methyltransferase
MTAGASAAWDRYWQFNRIASCMDDFGRSNYDDRVAGPWRTFFAALPPSSQILDVCSGNGAIALIAAEAGMSVTGVDLADIDPAQFVPQLAPTLRKIRFMGGTDAAKLPFPDGSFDAVVSQYGIEYAPRPDAWREAARVIAQGGRLRVAVHAADGNVAADSRASVKDCDFLLDEVQLAQRMRDCLHAVDTFEKAASPTEAERKAADESFKAFQSALDAVAQRLPNAADPKMLHTAGSVLADAFAKRRLVDLSAVSDKIDETETEVICHRTRQQALVDAAMGPNDLRDASKALSDCGLADVSAQPLAAGGRLLAHVIEARRPA